MSRIKERIKGAVYAGPLLGAMAKILNLQSQGIILPHIHLGGAITIAITSTYLPVYLRTLP
jgi:hypothetical protein